MSGIKARAIVLKEIYKGEADKSLILFAKDYGKLFVHCRGARKPKSKYLASSQLFAYSDFVLFAGKGFYSVTQCQLLNSFYNIRTDLETLNCGVHLLELTEKTILENSPHNDLLILLLKSLSTISKGATSPALVSAIFELKYFSYLGYLPQTNCCTICNSELSQYKYFDSIIGGTVCNNCAPKCYNPLRITNSTLKALNYILESPLTVLFNFTVSEQVLSELTQITKSYIQAHVDVKLQT